MPTSEQILSRMEELAGRLSYDFHDLSYLAQAMYCEKEPGRFNYTNDAMATVGDAVLKLIWSELFYSMGLDKDEITRRKADMESNNPSAPSRIDLPAPVSPVIMFRCSSHSTRNDSISA